MAPRWGGQWRGRLRLVMPWDAGSWSGKSAATGAKTQVWLIDKATNPPMVGPSTLKNQRVSLLPGDITYIDNMGAQDG